MFNVDSQVGIIDRLRELTTQTLHLQTRLRREHCRQIKGHLSTDSKPLSIGSLGVVQELKAANEGLRWQLTQRSKALKASKVVIGALENELARLRQENTILKTGSITAFDEA
jgi:hypothetical protein